MRLLVFAVLVVSTSAFFMSPVGQMPQMGQPGPQPKPGQMGPAGPPRLPDMKLVMQMVRQILIMLIPKLMANPNLASAFGVKTPPSGGGPPPPNMGGGGGGPPPNPFGGGPPAPPIGGGPPRPGGFGAPPGPGGYYGAGGMGMMGSDKFKDMRIMELLQDPSLGLMRDPYVAPYIPRGPPPYGWSLPDIAKDSIQYAIGSRIRRRGMAYYPKERELYMLIGDPKDPHMFTASRPL